MYAIRKSDLPLIGSSYNFVGADHQDVPISIYLVEMEPGRGAPLHTHEYDEVLITVEGRAKAVVGNEVREAGPGDILVVKAGTPHGFVNIGDSALKQIDVHTSPRFKQQNLPPTEISKRVGLPMIAAASDNAGR